MRADSIASGRVKGATPPSQGAHFWAANVAHGVIPAVGALDITLDQVLKLLGNPLALERHGFLAVFVHRRDGVLAGTRQADADIGVLAFARDR